MPTRRLAKSRRGRNRHDRALRIDYRTDTGVSSTRVIVLYRVRRRFDGTLAFDGFDFASRSELTFRAGNVGRLTDEVSGRSWATQREITAFLLWHLRRQRRPIRSAAIEPGRFEQSSEWSVSNVQDLDRFRAVRLPTRPAALQWKIRRLTDA